MRAVVCRAWCDPSGLRVEDAPDPPLTSDGVRIAVRAAGLNFADTLIIAGNYQTAAAVFSRFRGGRAGARVRAGGDALQARRQSDGGA